MIWRVLTYYRQGGFNTKSQILFLFLIFFTAAWISFEPIPFLTVWLIGCRYVYQRRWLTSCDLIVLASFPLALFLHFLQNAWHFDSLALALDDLFKAASVRSGIVSIDLPKFWNTIQKYFNRIERFSFFPGWALLFLAPLGLKKLKQEDPISFALTLVLFIAGTSWYIVMMHHAWEHVFVARHLVPFCAIAGVYGVSALLENVKAYWRENKPWITGLQVILLVYVGVSTIFQHFITMFLMNGFLYPWLSK